MKKVVWAVSFFLLLFLQVGVGAKSGKKKTDIENPISQMIAALGGEKFLNLSSLQISGRGMLAGKNPVKIDFTQEGKKLRSQIETNFWSSTEVFDGSSGWRRFGREKPFKLAQSPLELFAQNGLSRLQKIERDSFELAGDTLIEEIACFWVKSFDPTAGELWVFLDQKTFRPKELFSPTAGISAGLGVYRSVEGIWFPHQVNVRRGSQSYLELNLDTVAVNPNLPGSFFTFPEE